MAGEDLLKNAKALFEDCKFAEAHDTVQKAVELLQQDQDSRRLAHAYAVMLVSLKELGRCKQSKELGKECLLLMRETADLYGEAIILHALAEVNGSRMGAQGRERATKQAADAIMILRSLREKPMLAKALLTHAQVSSAAIDKRSQDPDFRLHESLAAMEVSEEALSLYKELGDDLGQAECHSMIAHFRVFGNLVEDWLEPAQASLKIHRRLGNLEKEAHDLYMIAYWSFQKQEWEEVLRYGNEALALFKKDKNRKGWMVQCLNLIQRAYVESKDVDSAKNTVKDCLHWFKDHNDKPGEAACHDLMADVHLSNEDYDEAITEATDATELVRTIGNNRWESLLLNNIASAHFAKNSAEGKEKAINAMKQSVQVFQKVKDMKGECRLLHNLCHLYLHKGKYKEAFSAAQKMRLCAKRAKDKVLEGVSLMALYEVHMHRRKPVQAIKMATEAVSVFENIPDQMKMASALVMMSTGYMMDEKYDKALEVCKKALKVSREIGCKDGEEHALSLLQEIEIRKSGQGSPQGSPQSTAKETREAEEAGSVASAPVVEQFGALDLQLVMDKATEVAKSVVAYGEEMHLDSPLMDMGMDSLSAVAFRNSLMAEFAGLTLPASVMFDYPNLRQLSDEIVDRSKTRAVIIK